MRPKKMTKEKFTEVLAEVEAGHTVTRACQRIGIGRSTFYDFLRKFPDNRDALKKAEEQRDVMITDEAIQAIQSAFPNDWRAAAWYLERKFPGRYSLRTDLRPQEAAKQATTEEEWKEMLRDSPELRRHLREMIDEAEGEADEGREGGVSSY